MKEQKKTFFLLIALGLLVRGLLAFKLESGVATELFLPFLQRSANFNQNPWFGASPDEFPYGTIMWVLVNAPRAIYSLFVSEIGPLASIFLLKLPLVFFEGLFLFLGFYLFPQQRVKWVMFYWLNPVLIYITHYHGQLDVIPMFLSLLAIGFYGSNLYLLGALAYGAAVGTKFHILLIFPLLSIYIWNNCLPLPAFKRIAGLVLSTVVFGLLSFYLPFEAHQAGYSTVLSPEAFKLFGTSLIFGDSSLFLGVLVLLLVLIRLAASERLTKLGLIVGSAILYLSIISFTTPRPGWFYWVIPQVVFFFMTFPYAPIVVFIGQAIAFFTYFWVCKNDLLVGGVRISDIAFTILQASNISVMWILWSFSERMLYPLGVRFRPVTIGIAGDSGSGKNRLGEVIKGIFGRKEVLEIEGDDYHKWERGHDSWASYTHLNPRANFLSNMHEHIGKLMGGASISYPHYDHSQGKFTNPRLKTPKKALLIQGLHTLYLRGLRDQIDLKIFMESQYLVRLGWKIDRDSKERGHPLSKVVETIKKRESDGLKFISTQKDFADLVISYLPDSNEESTEQNIIDGHRVAFRVEYRTWNDAIGLFEEMAIFLSECGLKAIVSCDEQSPDRLVLRVSGNVERRHILQISNQLFPNPRLITRSRVTPNWATGFDGLNQLIVTGLLAIKKDQRMLL